ncbi:hypothetical protein RHMOL_Rhmol02G0162600 [Rhododendron molle]|uniref:Uncharacterized protein n=1 Tax=Rhododendron molle TaxID=49168 RepID=A0ACC0PTU4_RHOML|nr:hypothetical protein RHMOL_Rhmol02G0162600 [Rhododendron molle]
MLAGKILSDRTFHPPNPSPTGWDSPPTRSNSVNGPNWDTWEEKPAHTRSDTILVKFDQPDPIPNKFHHFRTLFASQYLPLTSSDTIHMGMLESIYYFLKFAPYLKQEENYLGPAPYCDFKRMAQSQRALWLAEVNTPHYPVGFEESNTLTPLPEEPDWGNESKALQLLAAISFLDVSILEEQVPLTNFKWACETLVLCTIPSTVSYQIHCFLDFLPVIRTWLESNAAAYYFDQDLQAIIPSNKSKALQLLAAISFLDVSILEEQVPLTNFKWACETLVLCTIPSTVSYQIHCFLDFLPVIRTWLESNAAAYYFDQDLQDYALVKDRIEKLNNQIQSFQSESFDVVPAYADKKLQRCFKRKHMKRPAKEARLQRKAKALVLSFRPLLEKKLESDVKEDTRKMELKFLQFAWNKFHSLVTWSFPHYFENKKDATQHSGPSKA